MIYNKTLHMKIYKILFALSLSITLLIACAGETLAPEIGSLDLKVTIGPLCPLEPCNKTTDDIRKVYEAYAFTIKDTKTGKVVLEKKLTYNGTNGVLKSTDILVGQYELDVTPSSIFTKRNFPQTFIIEKGKTTQLEVFIDTGLR